MTIRKLALTMLIVAVAGVAALLAQPASAGHRDSGGECSHC